MTITYLSLTQDERDLMWAEEIHGFEIQYFQVKESVERQTQLIANLPKGEWPEKVLSLKGLSREKIAAKNLSAEETALAHIYWSRDKMRHDCCTADCEMKRVESFHAMCLIRVPESRRVAAILAAKTKREAETKARLGNISV